MIAERLNQYISNKGVSLYAFENKIGASRGSISKAIKNNANIGSNVLENILTCYPDLNPVWLLQGIGEMILKEKPYHKQESFNDDKNVYAVKSKEGIPLIPAEAMAGNGGGAVTIMEHDIQERYIVPDFTNVDFMIRVNGSSMYPKYNSGDVVACRLIKESSFLQWGKVHVIHTQEQGSLVKRLFATDDPNIIECKSDNEKYPPFQINRSEITNIALVVGAIRLE